MYSVRDEDDIHSFMTDEAKVGAREFARELIEMLELKAVKEEMR